MSRGMLTLLGSGGLVFGVLFAALSQWVYNRDEQGNGGCLHDILAAIAFALLALGFALLLAAIL